MRALESWVSSPLELFLDDSAARFVLLRSLGEPYLALDVGAEEQRSAFASLKELVA